MRSTRWCLTLNGYTTEDFDWIANWCEQNCKHAVLGHEVASTGTKHIQGWMYLKKRMTLGALRNVGPLGRAHFETAKGTNEQAADYCKKEGDFWEFGAVA